MEEDLTLGSAWLGASSRPPLARIRNVGGLSQSLSRGNEKWTVASNKQHRGTHIEARFSLNVCKVYEGRHLAAFIRNKVICEIYTKLLSRFPRNADLEKGTNLIFSHILNNVDVLQHFL